MKPSSKTERLLPARGPPKVPPSAYVPPAGYPTSGEYRYGPVGPQVDGNGIVLGQWSSGLCACWSPCVPNCLMAACLPFVSLSQITSRLGIARFGDAICFFFTLWILIAVCSAVNEALAAEEIGTAFNAQEEEDEDIEHGWLSFFNATGSSGQGGAGLLVVMYILEVVQSAASVVLFLSTWHLRATIRERFSIPGGCADDCCSVFWLSCCVIAQMATHVRSYRPGFCDFGPVDTLPPYQRGPDRGGGFEQDINDSKQFEPAYQRYGQYEDEEKDDDDDDNEMKTRMSKVDTPTMRYG